MSVDFFIVFLDGIRRKTYFYLAFSAAKEKNRSKSLLLLHFFELRFTRTIFNVFNLKLFNI